MKKKLQVAGMTLLLCLVGCDPSAKDYKKTMTKSGLPAKISIRVLDPDGNPVPDASVMFVFTFYNTEKTNDIIGKTDADGMASGEARANDKVVIHVDKPGWYRPEGDYSLLGSGKGYQTGRWEPWNPMLDITLRPRIRPRHDGREFKMRVCHGLTQDVTYGFDMLKKDIVLAGGKGEVADFSFNGAGIYKIVIGEDRRDTRTFYTNDVNVVFSNDGDGIVRMKRNLDSEFKFTYTAPENGYEQKVHFHSDYSRQGRVSTFPSSDEYLIFRISRKDEHSGETKRYYGIITSIGGAVDLKGKRDFSIEYYLNPNPGDRNIEYGP